MFSGQKIIQELKCKHVLSFCTTHFGESDDFKLAVGYFASLL